MNVFLEPCKKIRVFNVLDFLCDICPLQDNREWSPGLAIQYEKDFKVKIMKKNGCTTFLAMLHSHFDVEIWAPIGEALLQEVARFLAKGSSMKWCFFLGKYPP